MNDVLHSEGTQQRPVWNRIFAERKKRFRSQLLQVIHTAHERFCFERGLTMPEDRWHIRFDLDSVSFPAAALPQPSSTQVMSAAELLQSSTPLSEAVSEREHCAYVCVRVCE